MDKEEFRQRAALAALPEIIRLVKDNPKVIDPETGGRRVEDMQSIAAEIAIGYADALVKKIFDDKEEDDRDSYEDLERFEEFSKMQKLLDTPINSLRFPKQDTAIKNVFRSHDVSTLGDLVQFYKKDLLKFRGLGKVSLVAIDDLLEELGLCFGMDISKYE